MRLPDEPDLKLVLNQIEVGVETLLPQHAQLAIIRFVCFEPLDHRYVLVLLAGGELQ